jgi:hypothetical protein
VIRATPIHFSSRYLGRESELRSEFEQHFSGSPSGRR